MSLSEKMSQKCHRIVPVISLTGKKSNVKIYMLKSMPFEYRQKNHTFFTRYLHSFFLEWRKRIFYNMYG